MHWKPLSNGSKNPPLDTQILLKAYDGTVGIGVAFKRNKRIYFDYHAIVPIRGWLGEEKKSFTSWAKID